MQKDDVIYRQDAIDALDEIETEVADGYGFQYEKWRKHFCNLPSAQPDACENTCEIERKSNDMISRQAAIDAFDCTNELIVCGEANAQNVVNYINKVVGKIKDLPSAQPEIIRCKDCRFQDKGRNESESWNLCGYRPWLHVPTEDEHYCGYAERRTDE